MTTYVSYYYIQSYKYYEKGLAFKNLKKYEDAIKCFDESIRLNQNDASVYLNKSLALNNLNRLEEALIFYDEAIELDPNCFD